MPERPARGIRVLAVDDAPAERGTRRDARGTLAGPFGADALAAAVRRAAG